MGKYRNPSMTLRINQNLLDKLDIIAQKEMRTRTKLIEKILTDYVEENKERYGLNKSE